MERIKEKKQLLTDKEIRSILPVAGLTVCAILILAVSTDTFLSRQNLLNLFAKAASSQVMALGMALVLLSGYFDLTGGRAEIHRPGCEKMFVFGAGQITLPNQFAAIHFAVMG